MAPSRSIFPIGRLRVFAAIDAALASERGASVWELTDRLDVSESTVRTYLDLIRQAGFSFEKIASCHSRRGYVYRYTGAGVMCDEARRMLCEQEAVA